MRLRIRAIVIWAALATVAGVTSAPAEAARLDPAFGGDGIVEQPGSEIVSTAAWGVAQDHQNRILAVGGAGSRFAVARYLGSGELDPTFGDGGVARISAGREDGAPAAAVAVQPDGKIVVVGRIFSVSRGSGSTGGGELFVARLRDDGSPDLAFGPRDNGRYVSRHLLQAESVAITSSGKIIVGAEAPYFSNSPGGAAVLRLTPDGLPDPSFGRRGTVQLSRAYDEIDSFSRGYGVTDVSVLRGGRILAAHNFGGKLVLERLRRSGARDRRFGRRGRVVLTLSGNNCCGPGGAVFTRTPRGRILLAGAGERGRVFRIRRDGRLDRSFGNRGSVSLPLSQVTDVVVQGRRILISGASRVLRLKGGGKLDPTFFGDGTFSSIAVGEDLLIDRRGRIISSRGYWSSRTPYDDETGNYGYEEEGSFALTRFLP